MLEKVLVPKYNPEEHGDGHFPKTLCWIPCGPNGDGLPDVVCDGCHNRIKVEEHRIDASGEISPSLECPECGWHVWATLNEWDGGTVIPE